MFKEKHESFYSEGMRKKRLQSPGHIDEYICVTSVSVVMISITCIILLGALTLWVFMSTMTDKKNYSGIMSPASVVTDRFVNASGIVKKILISKEAHIKKGQAIAILDICGKDSIMRCREDGVVLTTKMEGETFTPNDPIYSRVDDNTKKRVLAFVNNETQRTLHPGMKAHIWPSNESPDNIGYFTGTIVSISNYPVSHTRIHKLLHNADLAEEILPPSHAIYQVVISVDTDKHGNLHWCFGEPANVDVSPGTICSIMTETNRRSIAEYMFERVNMSKNRVKRWVE